MSALCTSLKVVLIMDYLYIFLLFSKLLTCSTLYIVIFSKYDWWTKSCVCCNYYVQKFNQYHKRLRKESLLRNVSEFAEHLFQVIIYSRWIFLFSVHQILTLGVDLSTKTDAFLVNLAIPPPHPYLHFCLGPLCLSLWNRSFQTMLLALAKLFLCMSMELPLNIMIYHLISVISVNQSWESDRNEYNQPPGRGSSWFGPNFTEDGYRRGNPKKRTSRSFQSMSISLSTLLLYMSKTCLSLI